ncbi:MAG: beta-N-acetylhexosaminidase [Bacteroidetes bacterium]|nr:MAG: beta-N-acetylhexosaminidase [Bacteroidota bacterium]PTM09193.1 MAG: beta-N-acetylhexosaminidase [Bacteroidota bacterium]
MQKTTILFALLALLAACTPLPPTDLSQASLIPYPVAVTTGGERFALQAQTTIYAPPALEALGTYLVETLTAATRQPFALEVGSPDPAGKGIHLALDANQPELGAEGYQLTIAEKRIDLVASQPAGIFRGSQTLRQLVPLVSRDSSNRYWDIPTGTITDYPHYAYRGAMLDVSRHFFGVPDVKRFIDLIAAFKINFLHLHLADDQGWRIEIKSWPQLTTIGGRTAVGGGPGGFYTQDDYRELVRYAQARFVTIVPEIDMPGHTNAALASYPELNCNGIAPPLYTGTEVGFSTLCTDQEITYQFIDDVVRELAALTPGPYLHIGGDESHVTDLEDYIPFINRVQEIVHTHGKQMIGWDEVAHASLSKSSVVQYWAQAENALRGTSQGAKVILSPAHKVYLDMQYDSTTHLGLHWAAYIEVDSAYNWSPETLVPGLNEDDILGLESPLWTETVTTMADIEYLVFPRLLGHAELGWSPVAVRNWAQYRVRLGAHAPRLEAMGINFYRSKRVDWAR